MPGHLGSTPERKKSRGAWGQRAKSLGEEILAPRNFRGKQTKILSFTQVPPPPCSWRGDLRERGDSRSFPTLAVGQRPLLSPPARPRRRYHVEGVPAAWENGRAIPLGLRAEPAPQHSSSGPAAASQDGRRVLRRRPVRA